MNFMLQNPRLNPFLSNKKDLSLFLHVTIIVLLVILDQIILSLCLSKKFSLDLHPKRKVVLRCTTHICHH